MMRGRLPKILFLAVGTILLGALAGCGGGPSNVARSNFVEFTPEQKEEIDSQAGDEYRIQEGDQLGVAFFYEHELNQDRINVLSDGSISLIGVDRLVVAGHTISEVDSMVTTAYAQDYREPSLSIIVQESLGRRVYVMGEVKAPGLHELPSGGIDMLGAIGAAGGFNDNAAKAGTVLVRVTDDGYLVQEVDLSDLSSPRSAGLAMVQVQPYDVIYVPRSRIGDFAYFSKTVIAGIAQITRIAVDLKYLSGGYIGRY